MSARFFHIDAFADRPFSGNPAGVCLLETEPKDGWMASLASELDFSETAFLVSRDGGHRMRWFTPNQEVPLCGHATLASAHALWETGRLKASELARFETLSGPLSARKDGSWIEIDLPTTPSREVEAPPGLLEAVGVRPVHVRETRDRGLGDQDFILVLASEEEVRAAKPDFTRLRKFPAGVVVTATAASGGADVVSRYFAPWWGIDEDPVTGAAHCGILPFWSQRLEKSELLCYQASARGGFVRARLSGDRALLSGQAVTVLSGEIEGN